MSLDSTRIRDQEVLTELALPGEAWPLLVEIAAEEARDASLRAGCWPAVEAVLAGGEAPAGGDPWQGADEQVLLWPRALELLVQAREEAARPLLEWLAAAEGPLAEAAAGLLALSRGGRPATGPPWDWLELGVEDLEPAMRQASPRLGPLAGWLLARRLLAARQCASAVRRLRACRRAWSGRRPALERLALIAEAFAWERMGRDEELRTILGGLGRGGPGEALLQRLAQRLQQRDVAEGQAEALWIASHSAGGLSGRGPAHRRLLADLDLAAADGLPVLLEGETGTGKERAAEYIHGRVGGQRPLCRLNCAALPATLAEAELFGCAAGAFTGAVEREGLVGLADGGLLLLDEFAALAGPLQAKLLRVLEDGSYHRVGDPRPRIARLKLIAATSEGARLRSQAFRQDLLQRLAAHHLRLPPLRERPEDLELLVASFLVEAERRPRGHPLLTGERPGRLRRLPWPGNVRQLRFLVLRLAAAGPAAVDEELRRLEDGQLEPSTGALVPFAADAPLQEQLRLAEQSALRRALEDAGFDKRLAARRLGISLPTLYAKLRRGAAGEGGAVAG
jgi:DNA-binding NtrC family response regulator